MKLKRFTARSMPDALRMVRAALGDDAVILHSKSVSTKGLMGLFSAPRVEVTAAADVALPEDETPRKEAAGKPAGAGIREVPSVRDSLNRLEQQVAELSERIAETPRTGHSDPIPPDWASPYRTLTEKGVPLPVAHGIILEAARMTAEDSAHARVDAIRRVVEARFQICSPLQPGGDVPSVAVFVGPTGVGKTTTLAKIAATFHQKGHRVAVVTADTYRLAAVEQLRRFAEILEVPVEVVYQAEEFPGALRRHRNAEMILIDTAGRSQNHGLQMCELGDLLHRVHGADIYLVLAVTASPLTFKHQLRRFSILGPQKLILTKLDELPNGGSLLETVADCPLPIAYVTNGQEIPEDYWPADASRLARLAVSGSEIESRVGGTYARVG